MLRSLLLLLLATGVFACADGAEGEAATETSFFDLAGYIDAEAERLAGSPYPVTKTVTLNGATETKEIQDLDFTGDLRIFRNADINKPAWGDKYDTEVERLSGQHLITTYTARDSSLQTQRLLVEEDLGVPVRIEIDRKTGTVLSDGRGQLIYQPARGYEVSTQQENRFGDDVESTIRVEWR